MEFGQSNKSLSSWQAQENATSAMAKGTLSATYVMGPAGRMGSPVRNVTQERPAQ
jgi:hypothetical protein